MKMFPNATPVTPLVIEGINSGGVSLGVGAISKGAIVVVAPGIERSIHNRRTVVFVGGNSGNAIGASEQLT
jgi:hypothetical protein